MIVPQFLKSRKKLLRHHMGTDSIWLAVKSFMTPMINTDILLDKFP